MHTFFFSYGCVVTWGGVYRGCDSSAVSEELSSGVVSVHGTETGFAAIKEGGGVVTWGNGEWGGDSSAVAEELSGGVVSVHGTLHAIAALKEGGCVVTWGHEELRGDSSACFTSMGCQYETTLPTSRWDKTLKQMNYEKCPTFLRLPVSVSKFH